MKKLFTIILITFLFSSISNSQTNDDFKNKETITENDFENYPKFDFEKDYDKTNLIESKNGILKLKIATGEDIILKDIDDEESDGTELFTHFCNILDYYVIKVQYYETVGYIMINKMNGLMYKMDELPYLTPDKKHIFSFGGSIDYSPTPPSFQIWEVHSDSLSQIINLQIVDGNVEIEEIRWISNEKIAVKKLIDIASIDRKEETYEIIELNWEEKNINNIISTLMYDNTSTKIFSILENAKYKLQQGEYEDAITLYTEIIEIYPNSEEALQNRGISHIYLSNYHDAILDFSKIIDINPYNINAFVSRGLVKQELKDNRGSIFDFSKAIELDSISIIFCYRGISKNDLQDYRGAISDYSKAIQIEPKNEIAFYNRGISKYNLLDYSGAINDFNKTIEINSKNKEAYYYRGIIKIKNLKQKNSGCLDLSKAGELGLDKAYDEIKKYCQ